MPFTPEMRRKVDQIRDYLYGGGYPDPLTNAEQLSFLFFFYMIEAIDSANLRQAKATGRAYDSLFAGDWTLRNPLNAPEKGVETVPRERMRWSSWANAMSGEQLVTWVRDEVFPFFAEIGDAYRMSFMAQARLSIDELTVLTQIVTLVNELRLEQADPDSKGDLFEHVLRQIKQAGELGQFRTPRHIIRAIVDLLDPRIGETVYDPPPAQPASWSRPTSTSDWRIHRSKAAKRRSSKARHLSGGLVTGSVIANGASFRPPPSMAMTSMPRWSALRQ
jgi:type I restriction enzyme M protein